MKLFGFGLVEHCLHPYYVGEITWILVAQVVDTILLQV
jgi:hypothetical protein